MSRENRSFKNYIIYPPFQWRLVMMMMSLSLISAFSMIIFQYFAFQTLNDIGTEYNLAPEHPFFLFLKQFQDSFYLVLSSSLAVSIVFSFVFGILISHKVAGPLVKMRRIFNEVADKKVTDGPIYFRQGDFFQDVADAYNRRFKQ